MDNRITTIANYIMDKPEAGWSLQDILDAIRCEPSGVTLAEVHAALTEAPAPPPKRRKCQQNAASRWQITDPTSTKAFFIASPADAFWTMPYSSG